MTIHNDSLKEKLEQERQHYSNHTFDLGGTIRNMTPEQTLKNITPMLPAFGITRVADIGGLDYIGIPVAASIRPNSKNLVGAQGKGISRDLARISAIMESIEGYHMEYAPPPDIFGSYHDLCEKFPLIDPKSIAAGYFEHSDLSKHSLAWSKCFDLISEQQVFIPHALLKGNSNEIEPNWSYFYTTSNGLAAGNTLMEAISHALYEVIERDSVWRWENLSAEEKEKTLIDHKTIDSPHIRELVEKIESANFELSIWDASSFLGIPTFYCSIINSDSLHIGGMFFGCGSHLSKEVAVSRAITEAIQSRATVISGSRDDIFPKYYEKQRISQKSIIKETLSGKDIKVNGRDYSSCREAVKVSSIYNNLTNVIDCLREANYSHVLVFNHTRPEFNIPVVHVFVPNMNFTGFRV